MPNPHGKLRPAVEEGQFLVPHADGGPSLRQLAAGESPWTPHTLSMLPWQMHSEELTTHSHEGPRKSTGETDCVWPLILDATSAAAEGSLSPVGPGGPPGEGASGELHER